MSIAIIGLITLGLGALFAFRSSYLALTFLCCASLLGAASAMMFGGANISPGYLAVGFLAVALLIRPRQLANATEVLAPGRPGIFLLGIVVWALASGFLLPRLFAGEFMVYPLNITLRISLPVPLQPVGSNFNQAVYAMAGPVVFALVAALARTPEMLVRAANAIIIASIVNLILVVADVVTYAVGLESLLNFIRNADYAQHFGQKMMGIKRINGSFPEPSTFAAIAITLFAFNLRLWRGGVRTKLTGPIALLTFIAIIFSFSSTGYVSMIAYLSVAYAGTSLGLEKDSQANLGSKVNRSAFLSMVPIGALIGLVIVALKPDLLNPVYAIFDDSIASKLQSQSGVERSSWNTAGIRVLFDSYGLGAGTGSVRASSFVVAVLANLGLIGAALFTMFFLGLFLSRPEMSNPSIDYDLRQYAAASRAACFVGLLSATVSASSFDLGILFYATAGLACASVFYKQQAPANHRPKRSETRNTIAKQNADSHH